MNISKINGFVVVSENMVPTNPLQNGIVYKGLDREEPKGLYKDHYDKLLEYDLEFILLLMDENYLTGLPIGMGFDHLTEYSYANQLYNYCCEKYPSEPCDLIAFYSDIWKSRQIDIPENLNLEFMGYDIYFIDRYYSLISNGIFFREQYFEEFVAAINQYGLFSNKEICDKYVEHYRRLAEREICESWGMEEEHFIIEIHKVLVH